ncbi:uncharacterized protein LOC144624793 [Crassostrea virginica]
MGGQTCLSCRDIPEPLECSLVTECGRHEQCYVQKYVNNAGHVRYNVGCADNMTCNTLPPSRGSVRLLGGDNSIVCEACCNGTKLCNNQNLCGSQDLPAAPGTFCYACDYQPHPGACDRITLCSRDRSCYIGMSHDDTTMLYHYFTGCALRETKCQSLKQFPDNPYCSGCCEGNLCNDRCHRNITTDGLCLDRNPFCPLLRDRCHSVAQVREACPGTCSLCQGHLPTFTIKPQSTTSMINQTIAPTSLFQSTEINNNNNNNNNNSNAITTSNATKYTLSPSTTYRSPTEGLNMSVPLTNNVSITGATILVSQATPTSSTDRNCSDSDNTKCTSYDLFDVCNQTSIYYDWALSHCRSTCGFCRQGPCEDTLTNCAEYDSHSDLCTNHSYSNFVFLHCRRYCHRC